LNVVSIFFSHFTIQSNLIGLGAAFVGLDRKLPEAPVQP
jgi:hypothetical protein